MCNPGAVLRGHLDYGSMSYNLGNVGHLCVVFAILWRSSTVSEYSLASLHGCSACRGRRQVIFNYNPGPPRRLHDRVVSSTRKTFIGDMSFAGLQWCGRKFFHFLSGSLDYGSMSYELGYMGHL